MGLVGDRKLGSSSNANNVLSWEREFEELLTSFQRGLKIKDDSFHDRFFTNFCEFAKQAPFKTKKILLKTTSSWHQCCHSRDPRIYLFGIRLSLLYLNLWKRNSRILSNKEKVLKNDETTTTWNEKELKVAVEEEEEEEEEAINESLTHFETLNLLISQVNTTVQESMSKEDTSIESFILLSALEVLQSLPEAWDCLSTDKDHRHSFFLLCLKHPSIQIVRAAWKALCELPSLHLEIFDFLTPLFNSVNLLNQLSAAEFFCLKLELNFPILDEELTFLHPYFTSSNRLLRRKLLSLYQLNPCFYHENPKYVPNTLLLKLLNLGYFEDSILLLPYLTSFECTNILKTLSTFPISSHSILLSISQFQSSPLPFPLVDYILQLWSTSSTSRDWPIHSFFTYYQTYTKEQQQAMVTLLQQSLTTSSTTSTTLIYSSLRALQLANLATPFHSTLLELQHHEDEGISDLATQLLKDCKVHLNPDCNSQGLESPVANQIQQNVSDVELVTPLLNKLDCELELEDLLLRFHYILDRKKNGYLDSSDEEQDEEEEKKKGKRVKTNPFRVHSENSLDCYV